MKKRKAPTLWCSLLSSHAQLPHFSRTAAPHTLYCSVLPVKRTVSLNICQESLVPVIEKRKKHVSDCVISKLYINSLQKKVFFLIARYLTCQVPSGVINHRSFPHLNVTASPPFSACSGCTLGNLTFFYKECFRHN